MKTYCISDVHGHLENLNRFIETLKEDDRVFVLGDVIDKGEDPIGCLKKIRNDKRFVMLLGNHEYMMYDLLSSWQGSEEWYEKKELWLEWNSGHDTYDDYLNLSKEEQKEICEFIKALPLNIPKLKVNDKIFYLVHSFPHDPVQKWLKESDDETVISYVWDRMRPDEVANDIQEIVIAGHTVVQYYLGYSVKEVRPVFDAERIDKAHYIDIDGGLASRLPNARLIALCLDDLSYRLY